KTLEQRRTAGALRAMLSILTLRPILAAMARRPEPSQPAGLNTKQRQALELIAKGPHGATEQLLVLGHRFDSNMIADLVRTGLAAAQHQTANVGGGKAIEVVRMRITDAGRKAIGGERSPCLAAGGQPSE